MGVGVILLEVNWTGLAVLGLFIGLPLLFVIIRLFIRTSRNDSQAKQVGLVETRLMEYEGVHRQFNVKASINDEDWYWEGVEIGDPATITVYYVDVELFDPILGGKLSSDQKVIIQDFHKHSLDGVDDWGMRSTTIHVEEDVLRYKRCCGQHDNDRGMLIQCLDAATAAARDLLMDMAGEDVWSDDPKMVAKRERAERDLPPWQA